MNTVELAARPSIKQINFRVDPDIYEQMERAAAARGISVTEYCRKAAVARLQKRADERTTSDVYRVAVRALEDLQAVKEFMVKAIAALLWQQLDDVYRVSDEGRGARRKKAVTPAELKALADWYELPEEVQAETPKPVRFVEDVISDLLSETARAKRNRAQERIRES